VMNARLFMQSSPKDRDHAFGPKHSTCGLRAFLCPADGPLSLHCGHCAALPRTSSLGHDRTLAPQQTARLFDDLVGGREQIWRHGQAQSLGRFEVKDKFEEGWLHDRHFCNARASEDLANILAGLALHPMLGP
jgi:hypothetical protein